MKKRLFKKRILKGSLLNRAFLRDFGLGSDLLIFLGSSILWHKTRTSILPGSEHLATLMIRERHCYGWGKAVYRGLLDGMFSEVSLKSLLTHRNRAVRETARSILG